ncbi:hypothetical protein [Streptacidiphilus neutrinimicus]|uniref:hypothetical protein n=1 Tax=Streptacidiphilus neutrinimicus TaxID=105420 RepID=UPI0005A5D83E|nr:hypothetical protein [Streptacidiphilus neutrinimicus]
MAEYVVPVSFYTFALQDTAEQGEIFPAGLVPKSRAAFVEIRPGRLDITTAAHTHEVVLTVNVLTGPPAPDAVGNVEESTSGTVTSPSGELAAWEMLGRTPYTISLSHGPGTYGFDAVSMGGAAVRRAETAIGGGPTGAVERIRIRFWPAG